MYWQVLTVLVFSSIVPLEYFIREKKGPPRLVKTRTQNLFLGVFFSSLALTGIASFFISSLWINLLCIIAVSSIFRTLSLKWLKIPKKGEHVIALWNGSKINGIFEGKRKSYLVVKDNEGQEFYCNSGFVWQKSVNKVIMKYILPNEVLASATKCSRIKDGSKNFPCLDQTEICCKIEKIIDERIASVKKHISSQSLFCKYSISEDNAKSCTCPVRIALWKTYKV